MASRKRKRRNFEHAPRSSPTPVNRAEQPHPSFLSRHGSGIALQITIFLMAFAILFSRRPDAILNAQFYAEDGMVWYPEAYRFGLHSFLIPVAGYLHALIRSVALISLLFPFSLAPLVMNLCAILVQILPVNLFLSSRFSQIPLKMRLLGSFVYLAVPNCWEIHANITNVQWHLVLLACLVLLALPENRMPWRIFDGTVLVLTSFSSPIALLLVPVAAALWWKRRQKWAAFSFVALVPGALVEVLVALLSHTRASDPLGVSFYRLVSILGRQVFFSALFGFTAQYWFLPGGPFLIDVVAATVGLAVVLYALRYSPFELKVFIVFCFAVLALGLARPLAGSPAHPQWAWLCIPGRGNRYYFLPMLGFLASLFWMAMPVASTRVLRHFAVALLLLLPVGVFREWSHPPFEDFHFQKYAEQFESAPAGTKIAIPINPRMTMEITKQ
jgi:hypothetical protein